ncbi:MAG: recombinase family protein [Selenomonadaceae bacterium]|nr:recombinase family protein [Selenomonadaceae bacterium]
MGKTYGYIRVSTREQNEDRQRVALEEFGIPKRQIFVEKQSGKDFNRPVYQRLLKKLKPEDVLVVKSIDRLGRNYKEILEQWRIITKERGANIVILDMPILDTRQGKDLIGTVISDIVLQLLSYVAETERAFIRQRQAEGIKAAMARGVRFGRERKERPLAFDSLRDQWSRGDISARAAARLLGITHSTFLRWARE